MDAPTDAVKPGTTDYTSLVKRFAKLCKQLWDEAAAPTSNGLDRVLRQATNALLVRGRPLCAKSYVLTKLQLYRN